MINPVAQGYGVEMVAPASRADRTASPQAGSGGAGDTVTISEEARAKSAEAAAQKNSEAPSLGLLSKELPLLTPEELASRTEEVQDRITALFRERGIPTTPPVELYVDEAGGVRVKGDHPYKDEMEQALAGDDTLSNDFRMVSAQTSIQEAAKEHSAFAAAYAKDPDAAVARFAHLFDNRPDDPYTMIIGEEEVS